MEKNCLVTQLKSRTGNTDLPVLGFIKIKISSITELNEDPWNLFFFTPIEGKSVTVKILGEGYMYTSKEKRETNTDGVKSLTFTSPILRYFSNGDYEILIEKYTIDGISSGKNSLRSDNIHFDYKTFKHSNLTSLEIQFASTTKGYLKYESNISGSIKSLPTTITGLKIYGDAQHPVYLGDFEHISKNLTSLVIYGKDCSYGSFDDVDFNKVMTSFSIQYCNFTGNVENVPIAINGSFNSGKNSFYGNVREPIERMAKNATAAKDVYYYVEMNRDKIFWRDIAFANLPKPGWLYLTLNGTGGVTVYSDEARTNLLGSFNGTTWTYPS